MQTVTHPTSGFPETRASLLERLGDAGDSRSWEEFARSYRPIIYRMARRQGMQHADAEELGQEVMLAISRSVERWVARPERGKFRHWLLRIARNMSINLRTRPKYRTLASGREQFPLDGHADPHPDLSCLLEVEYRRAMFRIAAANVQTAVADNTWQAFWLTAIEEVPIAQAAEQLGMPIGSVYVARNRVMARLGAEVRRIETEESLSSPQGGST